MTPESGKGDASGRGSVPEFKVNFPARISFMAKGSLTAPFVTVFSSETKRLSWLAAVIRRSRMPFIFQN